MAAASEMQPSAVCSTGTLPIGDFLRKAADLLSLPISKDGTCSRGVAQGRVGTALTPALQGEARTPAQ